MVESAFVMVFVNIFLYSVAYQLFRPAEPFLVETFSSSQHHGELNYAYLQAFYSLIQTVGALVFGILLDWFGPNVGFLISFSTSIVSCTILHNATSIYHVFLSKFPTLLQSGYLCAQVAIAKVTTTERQSTLYFGWMTMAYSAGMVVGPVMGGYLAANHSKLSPTVLSIYLSFASLAIALIYPIPQTSLKFKADRDTETTPLTFLVVIHKVAYVLSVTWAYLLLKLMMSFAHTIRTSSAPIILKNLYELNEHGVGSVTSLTATTAFISNGVLLPRIQQYFNNDGIAIVSRCISTLLVIHAISALIILFADAYISHTYQMYLYILCGFSYSIIQHIVSSTITGMFINIISRKHKGTVLGIDQTLFSITKTIAPLISVRLWKSGKLLALNALCICVYACVGCMLQLEWSRNRRRVDTNDTDDVVTETKKQTKCD